ncbi:MAG: 4Fe-4S cluster-binding domain-containing protein [Oscillospiraceae bacterium]|nr:4Fe-4S cluster-binding domain-containing protein [Oscillospiraceae bacterium]
MTVCTLCPRCCGADREAAAGFCRSGTEPRLARAALHLWEEPCISGTRGSGTIFFSGCSLRCVYCQNGKISAGNYGKTVSVRRLREIYSELIDQGAHNINLVNPTHWTEAVIASLEGGLPVPVVYNTGGYDSVETLRRLEDLVDIYLPDMKYADGALAGQLSSAPDYPETARAAIREMVRQTGPYELDDEGLLLRGTVIRHLILPGHVENTLRVIDWVADCFPPGTVLFSLMSQYTPCGDLSRWPELQRRLTQEEYDLCREYLDASGIEDGFFQELSSAEEEYIPPFDLTGI